MIRVGRVDLLILGLAFAILGLFLAVGISIPAIAKFAYVPPCFAGIWFILKAAAE